ncbi:ribonuclease E/G [Palleronia abyssalis]|uniref:Ribonuclease G n=1 Tax=Palleronia abyssalis TaxID=1501240 RepID=A0A2R8C1X7_9RHOB|nr:ribonuclease E/G [Palleronia abyssalis]SPJ26425.1 Ribonuclease G [Palleronia abyssalis]
MKGSTVHLDTWRGRLAAARVVDGQLDDFLVAPDEATPLPGTVYRAVVDRPLKGQGGVTLRLPEGRAYLRNAKGLSPGSAILVQVSSYADDGKAVPVSAEPLFKSRYAIVTPGKPGYNISRQIKDETRRDLLLELVHDMAGPPKDLGIIVRSSAEAADDEEIAVDIAAMLELARSVITDDGAEPELLVDGPDPHTLAWREWPVPDALFTDPGNFRVHGILDMIDALSSPRIDLPGGYWMSVEPTRALVAVDVNTGADTSLAAGLKANIAAARRLPAALRCRGLGGQITVDMAPAPKKERRTIEQALRAAFRPDAIDTTLAGWTPLGHFELQRKRERLPLHLIAKD